MDNGYLRVSVTDRCDLRCAYCMPMRTAGAPKSDLLTYEEIVEVVRVLLEMGARKVRLTGGEPLQRPGIAWLLQTLPRILDIEDLGITTNGTRLGEFVRLLAEAGYRVNVHIDTLDPKRYRERMGGQDPRVVADATREAVRLGIFVKINAVCSEGTTRTDAVGLIDFAREIGAPVRFIEAMPVSGLPPNPRARSAMAALEQGLIDAFQLKAIRKDGVTRMYLGPRGEQVGFVTPSHARFCDGCNKVRLSSRGRLRSCLFGSDRVDLRPFLRLGDISGLRNAAALALASKAARVGREGFCIETMGGIGG